MRDQEIIGLWEAYQQVHAQPEEVEQLDEIKQATTVANDKIPNFQNGKKAKPVPGLNVPPSPMEEGVDLFDYLLEYLVAEGYADTNKAALAIMANMSEEWRQSIVEGVGGYDDPILGPHTPGGKLVRGGVEAAKKVVTGVVKGVGSEFAKPAPQPPGGLTPMQRLQRRPDPTIR